jgi:hypothetical protein
MQLYLFRVLVGIFYVDIYQQMSTKKRQNQQKNAKKTPKITIVKYVTLPVTN